MLNWVDNGPVGYGEERYAVYAGEHGGIVETSFLRPDTPADGVQWTSR